MKTNVDNTHQQVQPMFCQKHKFCIPVQVCFYFMGRAVHGLTGDISHSDTVLTVLALQGGGWRRKT